jgi:integrase
MAYIRQLASGKWQAQVERHGNRPSETFDTKREAQTWGRDKELELDALKSSKGKTFAAAVAYYLQTVSVRKRDGALDWERRRFDAMREYFGDQAPLARIDSARIGQWRDERLKTVSGSTVQREANLLRNLFKCARDEWKWISQEPFRGVKLPDHNPARTQLWTWQLIKRVLRAKRTGKTAEVQRAFRIALHTGMRLSEVLGAKVHGKVAVLPKSKTMKVPVKVPLARKGAVLLGEPFTVDPNEASTLFSTLCRELLIEGLTFHDSRASALTWLSRRVDVMTLARISRHKDLKVLLNSYYRETAEQIAARL